MFCSKCGSANQEGTAYCTNCGAPLNNQSSGNPIGGQPQFGQPQQQFGQPQFGQQPQQFGQPQQQFRQPQFNNPYGAKGILHNKKLIGIGAAALAVIAAVIIVIVCLVGKGAKTPQEAADKFAKGINTHNAQMIAEAIGPDEFIRYYKEEGEMDELLEDFADSDISKCSIKIKGDAYDSYGEVDDFKEVLDEIGIRASEVVFKNVTLRYYEDGEYEEGDDEAILYKVKGKWYIMPV